MVQDAKVTDIKSILFFGGSDRQGEIVVDISRAWDKRLAATRADESQFGHKEEALKWLARSNHEIGNCCGLEYAEAFQRIALW